MVSCGKELLVWLLTHAITFCHCEWNTLGFGPRSKRVAGPDSRKGRRAGNNQAHLALEKNGCSRNNISRSASTGFTSIFFAYGFFSEYPTVNCNWNLQQHLHVVAGFWRAKKIDF